MQSKPPSSTGALIGGLAVGIVLGGTAGWVLVLVVAALVGPAVARNSNVVPFAITYVIAVAVGASAVLARKQGGFVMGLLIGLSVGMLGGTAVCNLVIVGLGGASAGH